MPETTQQYHRVPSARKKKGNELRTVTISKGIKALYDIKRKIIVTYLFDRTKYTMKKAKEWVKTHKSSKAYLQVAELQSLKKGWGELYRDIRKETIEALKE